MIQSTTSSPASQTSLLSGLRSLVAFFRYNATHVFAGKFIYFLALGIGIFILVTVIYVLDSSTPPDAEAIYYFLLVPGVLLIFYPSAYSIQSDVDSRMIETLFGIPDYRYKVWLARNITMYLVVTALLFLLALFCRLTMADFSIWSMSFQLLFPVAFIGSLAFMTATITRSGNGTAVIMVIILLVFWIAAEPLEGSRWNLFHNPFTQVDQFETFLWAETTLYNRIYLLTGAAVATMFGLLRLQRREKLI